MQSEHLRKWIGGATHEVEPDSTHWRKVVALVQAEVYYGTLYEECTWQTPVMIVKGDKSYLRGFGLMEVLWNTTAGIINQRLTSEIRYRDTLYEFWAGRGMETSTL